LGWDFISATLAGAPHSRRYCPSVVWDLDRVVNIRHRLPAVATARFRRCLVAAASYNFPMANKFCRGDAFVRLLSLQRREILVAR
jgi:hypothetical protein